MPHSLFATLAASGFTFLMTAAGAAVVFFFSKDIPDKIHRTFLGFAAGVMIAASIWSLLIPSLEQSAAFGAFYWLPATAGFLLGSFSLFFFSRWFDCAAPKKFPDSRSVDILRKNVLLIFAVTLHNIPEGMAVGLAWPLALGIGIQNFPEGAAIALPLRKYGFSRCKAFLLGSLTGLAEPVFGILAALLVSKIQGVMPWLLAFSAGAMFFVSIEELIPEAHQKETISIGTLSFILGFLLMMLLDVFIK